MLRSSLESAMAADEPRLVPFEDLDLQIHFKRGTSRALVIIFHGAVDQAKRRPPFFQPHFEEAFGAHQLTISDPSLTLHRDLKAAWYAGGIRMRLQQILPRFFQEVAGMLESTRTIYFGASSGGHAALYYSHCHAGSLALAVNPQINLDTWLPASMQTYARHCWPGTRVDDLSNVIVSDLRSIYSKGMGNHVCLLNSAGDRYHLFNQTQPFLAAIPTQSRERIVFHSEFYGVLGHSGSIPYAACQPWLKVAVQSPTFMADDLLLTRHRLLDASLTAEHGRAETSSPNSSTPSPRELELSALVRDWQLRQQGDRSG